MNCRLLGQIENGAVAMPRILNQIDVLQVGHCVERAFVQKHELVAVQLSVVSNQFKQINKILNGDSVRQRNWLHSFEFGAFLEDTSGQNSEEIVVKRHPEKIG